LLFILCFNGGVLALECILQRVHFGDYQGKLLFLVEPTINGLNLAQFGPFAYRSNAASYLNLIWPIGLGLLVQLGRHNLEYGKKRIGNGPELLLAPCIILSASCPIISSSRGGALVMIGLLIIIAGSLMFVKVQSKFLRFTVLSVLFVGLGVGYQFGWEKFESRLINIFSEDIGGRKQIYEVVNEMINNYGLFGSGPGTFETIVQFELGAVLNYWETWVHNDYLEFYLTFGKAGASILIIIGIIFLFQSAIALMSRERILAFFVIISLIGVFIHAVADFPLQTYSVLILICILLNCITSAEFQTRK